MGGRGGEREKKKVGWLGNTVPAVFEWGYKREGGLWCSLVSTRSTGDGGGGGEGTGATPPPDVFALLRFTFYLSP